MLPTYEEVLKQIEGTNAWHQLEEKRHFYIKIRNLVWVAGIAISLFGVWLFWVFFLANLNTPEDNPEGAIYAAFAFFIIVLLGVYVIWQGNRRMHKKYSYHYKKLFVPELVTSLITQASYSTDIVNARYTCQYNIDEGIPLEQLQAIPLFNVFKSSDKWKSEDLFIGTLGVTDFQFANMKVWEVTEDLESKSKSTKFTGLVFLAHFNKHFEGTTVIQSRKGRYTALKVSIGSKMKTADDTFDRLFQVLTTDEKTTRYLLSDPMLKRLLALCTKFPGKGISICLHNGMLALAIHNVDLFETNGLKPLTTGAIQNTYEEIKSVFEIVDLLNLNTGI